MGNELLELQKLALQHKLQGKSSLSNEQKRMIVHAHLVDGIPQAQLAKKFGIRRESIWRWISTFANGGDLSGNKEKPAKSHPKVEPNPKPMPRKNPNSEETPEQELARLREENAKLQEALKMSEWSNHAKDVMIDIAEKTFNISIRKKSGAKQ